MICKDVGTYLATYNTTLLWQSLNWVCSDNAKLDSSFFHLKTHKASYMQHHNDGKVYDSRKKATITLIV